MDVESSIYVNNYDVHPTVLVKEKKEYKGEVEDILGEINV